MTLCEMNYEMESARLQMSMMTQRMLGGYISKQQYKEFVLGLFEPCCSDFEEQTMAENLREIYYDICSEAIPA